MTFEAALIVMRSGGHVYRKTWTGPRSQWSVGPSEGVPVLSVIPPRGEKYAETIILRNELGDAYVWGPSQASVMADDWEVMFQPEGG